jgi:hypothetical protein
MNSFLIQSKLLLTGQSGPSTGESVEIARLREANLVSYYNGNNVGNVILQYKSPFFENDWVTFYDFGVLASGYSDTAFLTTPMSEIRAVCSGSGQFWCACLGQN